MYAGDYLSGSNLGHEIVNLFTSDKGENYIYVNPDGLVNPKYNGKIKGVLLVRKTDSIHKLEVLGVAKVDESSQIAFKSKKMKRDDRLKEYAEGMDAYIDGHEICYGGVSYRDLFKKNKFNGKYENYYVLTFKVKELLLPYRDEDKKVYITDKRSSEKGNCHLENVIFPSQSLKRYVDTEEFPADFERISELISNKTFWDKSRKTEVLKSAGKNLRESDNFNYLDIVGKQDDENVFSNLISYFLASDGELLTDFCKEVLKAPGVSKEAEVEREKAANGSRMDIYIHDENYAIVIENKIKSEVNSVEERHNFTGKQVQSQLADYYRFIEKEAKGKQRRYFILMPNYHRIDIKKYKHSEKYTKLNYSDVLRFFETHEYKNREEAGYYRDFIKALKRHAENYYDDQYAEMKRRFVRRITEVKSQKNA
jgi:hypothetical protein